MDNLEESKVLVVDDVQDNLWIVEDVLQQTCRVISLLDGGRTLEVAREHMPDLILLDVVMPGADGFAICRLLKADPDLSGIPVVFLTSLDSQQDVCEGFDAGGIDYLTKPFKAMEMRARVATHLRLARLEKESSQQIGYLRTALESEESCLTFFSRHSSDIVLQVNAGGVILCTNPAWERLTGSPVSAPAGKYLYEIVESTDAPDLSLALQKAWNARAKDFSADFRLSTPGGALPVRAAFSLSYGPDGSFAGMNGILCPAGAA